MALPDWLERQLKRQEEEKVMRMITAIQRVTIGLEAGDYFIERGTIYRDVRGTLEGVNVLFTIVGLEKGGGVVIK